MYTHSASFSYTTHIHIYSHIVYIFIYCKHSYLPLECSYLVQDRCLFEAILLSSSSSVIELLTRKRILSMWVYVQKKSCTFNISWFPKSATTQKQLEVKISRRCWTSTCLQRAARRRPTLRSRFFKTALHFNINWFTRFPWPKTSRCTLSRSTRRASRSHYPTPRTTRCSFSSRRTIITPTIFLGRTPNWCGRLGASSPPPPCQAHSPSLMFLWKISAFTNKI